MWCVVAVLAVLAVVAGHAPAREREPNGAYAERRAALRAKVDGPVVLFGFTGREDSSPAYVFAQEENFYYLTGHNEEGAALLLVPAPPEGKTWEGPNEILFLPARNPQLERWNGVRLGWEDPDAAQRMGLAVRPFETLKSELQKLAPIFPTFYTLLPGQRETGYPHRSNWAAWLKEALPAAQWSNVAGGIGELRQIKSPTEMKLLTKAIEVSIDAHLEAMRLMRPGIFEYQVAAAMEYVHKRAGCEKEGYAPIVGAAFNSTVLHYAMPVNRINDGDIVVLDVGAQCDGYTADITRTLPANGKFSPRQREIYEIVLGAQNAVFAALKPGMTMGGTGENSLQRIALQYINTHGKDKDGNPLGRYYIHGLGHHIGLNVHDAGPARPLMPGMVVTIEPGIYIPQENLGVRIEDCVLITENGFKHLTARLPRTVEDVEKTMAAARAKQ
jgi:Xaa-Pro aminopeptidase